MKLKNDLVIFDLETTGTWVEKDKIVEIAVIKCGLNWEESTYYKKINPMIPIPKAVTKLIGINNDEVKECPAFKDISHELLNFIGESDFAGFNIERFDLPLLEREFEECSIKFNWRNKKIYDSQKVFHLNEKRDLTAAYKFYCNKELKGAHSALVDTTATLEILKQQIKKYSETQDYSIETLEKFNYAKNIEFYDDERKFRWWNGKLYMMFGKYARKYCLQEIAKNDPKYLEWIVSANFSNVVKELASDALKGQFPEFKEETDSIDENINDTDIDDQLTLF